MEKSPGQNDSDVVFKNNVIQRKDNLFVKNNSYSLQTKYSGSVDSYQQKTTTFD